MTSVPYSEPVARLLALDAAIGGSAWHDYGKLGLGREHAPELLRMVYDPRLSADTATNAEVWAPLHAVRALAQMQASEAIEGLLPAFQVFDENDWFWEELPKAYALLGSAAIPALRAYLADPMHELYPRVRAAESLEKIARNAPDAREECVAAIREQLRHAPTQRRKFNALLVSTLMDMKAVEAVDDIRAAFEANAVDINIHGDLEDVEIDLGVRTERDTPQPRYNAFAAELAAQSLALETMMADNPSHHDSYTASEPYVRSGPKTGRNDPCPCGSGKKYKKCCGQA